MNKLLTQRSRFFCALLVFFHLFAGPSTPLWSGAEPSSLTSRQKVLHLLNRLGFGPRPGDIERIQAMGIDAYIEQQLHPLSIADPVVDKRLSSLETLAMSSRELATMSFPPRERRGRREAPDPSMNRSPDENRARQEQQKNRRETLWKIQRELAEARLMRGTYSERQLQEVMVDFWMNHFNVLIAKGFDRILTTPYEQNVIRPRVMGRFEDLLMATGKRPAMLFYLDNWISSAPAHTMEARIQNLGRDPRFRDLGRARRGRPGSRSGTPSMMEESDPSREITRVLRRAKGLNENYARELMELHTLGVDGGYTQEDVIQLARCLTGWTMTRPQQGATFRFLPLLHEEGDKVVLGHKIRSGGVEEGEQVIRLLARHPSTARFISTKLVRRFVADDPPAELVKAATRTFTRTGGDIREVLRTIFAHPLFFSPPVYQAKVKKPLELVVSALRVVEADVEASPPLVRLMAEMGEALYMCSAPTGYPDVASAWVNTNSLLKRLNFAVALAAGRLPRVRADIESAEPFLKKIGSPAPAARELEQLLSTLRDRGTPAPEVAAASVAFMLGSPQFQKR